MLILCWYYYARQCWVGILDDWHALHGLWSDPDLWRPKISEMLQWALKVNFCDELEVNFKWTGILFLVLFVVYQTKWTAQALILSFLFRIWSSDLQLGLVRNRRIEVIDFDLNFDQTNDLTALIIAFKALAFHTHKMKSKCTNPSSTKKASHSPCQINRTRKAL